MMTHVAHPAPMAPIRLTVVMTHPVQYFSPWFRFITESCPDIHLTVLYGAIPTGRHSTEE
jgi:hypothetical protein